MILSILAVVRAALPWLLSDYVERKLDAAPDYEATLGDLDLNLWRGAYEIEGIRIYKTSRPRDGQPFFEAARVDLSLYWDNLISGRVRGSTTLHRPVLRLIETGGPREEAASQTGEGVSWARGLQSLFPLRIDRFAVRDAEVRYEKSVGEEHVDLFFTDVYIEMLNLTNIQDERENEPTVLEAAARPFGTGELEARLRFLPASEQRKLELEAELRNISLVDMNDFISAYVDVDVASGTLGLFTEIAVEGQRFEGYVKTVIEDADVLESEEIDEPSEILSGLWEGFIAIAAEVLENQPHDRLATKIPLEGQVSNVDTDLWSIVTGILENAFLRALQPMLDDSIHVDFSDQGAPPEQESEA